MVFSNEQVSPEQLPAVQDVAFSPLEAKYLLAKRIAFFISGGIVAIIVAVLIVRIEALQKPLVMYSIIAGYIFLSVIGWISDTVSFKNSGYALRDKDILFRRGWLIRKIRVVPLNRVQHVSVQSGPIERRYQLASVSIFTAGAGAADFTIHGLTSEKATQIKEWISNQLNGAADN